MDSHQWQFERPVTRSVTRGRADETTDEDNAPIIPAAPGHQASATAAAVSMDVEQVQELAPPEPIMEDPVELGLPQAVLDSRGPDDEDLSRCVGTNGGRDWCSQWQQGQAANATPPSRS